MPKVNRATKEGGLKQCGVCELRKNTDQYKKWRWRSQDKNLSICKTCDQRFIFPFRAKDARNKGNKAEIERWIENSKRKYFAHGGGGMNHEMHHGMHNGDKSSSSRTYEYENGSGYGYGYGNRNDDDDDDDATSFRTADTDD